MTSPRNLYELATAADVIVQGKVTSATVEPHPQFKNLHTVVVHFLVHEVLKGNVKVDEEFTFRQFIWDIRDMHDAAEYRQMGEIVLFLNKPNANGLTSPTGLGQGRFHLMQDKTGATYAVNETGNFALFRNTGESFRQKAVRVPAKIQSRVDQSRGAPVPLNDFKDLVRQLAGTNKK